MNRPKRRTRRTTSATGETEDAATVAAAVGFHRERRRLGGSPYPGNHRPCRGHGGRSSRKRATLSRPWPNPHGGLATDESDI